MESSGIDSTTKSPEAVKCAIENVELELKCCSVDFNVAVHTADSAVTCEKRALLCKCEDICQSEVTTSRITSVADSTVVCTDDAESVQANDICTECVCARVPSDLHNGTVDICMKEADSCETSKSVNRKLFRSQLVDISTSCKADVLTPDAVPSCKMASNAGESSSGPAVSQTCHRDADTLSTYASPDAMDISRSGETVSATDHVMDGTGHLVTSSTPESQAMCTRVAFEDIDKPSEYAVADCCGAVTADVEDEVRGETVLSHPVDCPEEVKCLQLCECPGEVVNTCYSNTGIVSTDTCISGTSTTITDLSSKDCSRLCPLATCDPPSPDIQVADVSLSTTSDITIRTTEISHSRPCSQTLPAVCDVEGADACSPLVPAGGVKSCSNVERRLTEDEACCQTVSEVKAVDESVKCDRALLVRSSVSDLHDRDQDHEMHKPAEDLIAVQIFAEVTSNEQPPAYDREGSNSRSGQEPEPGIVEGSCVQADEQKVDDAMLTEGVLSAVCQVSSKYASSCVPGETNGAVLSSADADATTQVNDESVVVNLSLVTEVRVSTSKAVSDLQQYGCKSIENTAGESDAKTEKSFTADKHSLSKSEGPSDETSILSEGVVAQVTCGDYVEKQPTAVIQGEGKDVVSEMVEMCSTSAASSNMTEDQNVEKWHGTGSSSVILPDSAMSSSVQCTHSVPSICSDTAQGEENDSTRNVHSAIDTGITENQITGNVSPLEPPSGNNNQSCTQDRNELVQVATTGGPVSYLDAANRPGCCNNSIFSGPANAVRPSEAGMTTEYAKQLAASFLAPCNVDECSGLFSISRLEEMVAAQPCQPSLAPVVVERFQASVPAKKVRQKSVCRKNKLNCESDVSLQNSSVEGAVVEVEMQSKVSQPSPGEHCGVDLERVSEKMSTDSGVTNTICIDKKCENDPEAKQSVCSIAVAEPSLANAIQDFPLSLTGKNNCIAGAKTKCAKTLVNRFEKRTAVKKPPKKSEQKNNVDAVCHVQHDEPKLETIPVTSSKKKSRKRAFEGSDSVQPGNVISADQLKESGSDKSVNCDSAASDSICHKTPKSAKRTKTSSWDLTIIAGAPEAGDKTVCRILRSSADKNLLSDSVAMAVCRADAKVEVKPPTAKSPPKPKRQASPRGNGRTPAVPDVVSVAPLEEVPDQVITKEDGPHGTEGMAITGTVAEKKNKNTARREKKQCAIEFSDDEGVVKSCDTVNEGSICNKKNEGNSSTKSKNKAKSKQKVERVPRQSSASESSVDKVQEEKTKIVEIIKAVESDLKTAHAVEQLTPHPAKKKEKKRSKKDVAFVDSNMVNQSLAGCQEHVTHEGLPNQSEPESVEKHSTETGLDSKSCGPAENILTTGVSEQCTNSRNTTDACRSKTKTRKTKAVSSVAEMSISGLETKQSASLCESSEKHEEGNSVVSEELSFQKTVNSVLELCKKEELSKKSKKKEKSAKGTKKLKNPLISEVPVYNTGICGARMDSKNVELGNRTSEEAEQLEQAEVLDLSLMTRAECSKPPEIGNQFIDSVPEDRDGVNAAEQTDSEKMYYCRSCTYRAHKKGQLRKHLGVHGVHACAHCEFTGNSHALLEEHMAASHPSRCGRRLCKRCHVLFRAGPDFELHELHCTGEKQLWPCPACDKSFKFVSAMKTHLRRWHSAEGGADANEVPTASDDNETIAFEEGRTSESSGDTLPQHEIMCETALLPETTGSKEKSGDCGAAKLAQAISNEIVQSGDTGNRPNSSAEQKTGNPSFLNSTHDKQVDKPFHSLSLATPETCSLAIAHMSAASDERLTANISGDIGTGGTVPAGEKCGSKPLAADEKDSSVVCTLCQKTFRAKRSMIHHRKMVHEGGRVPKPTAEAKRPKNDLQAPGRGAHGGDGSVSEEKAATAEKLCGRVPSSCADEMTGSRQKSSPVYVCILSSCGHRFKRPGQLHRHEEKHTELEKPFHCDWTDCRKAFIYSENLLIHRRQHTEPKPYRCALCPLAYWQKSSLRSHQHKVHDRSKTGIPIAASSSAAVKSVENGQPAEMELQRQSDGHGKESESRAVEVTKNVSEIPCAEPQQSIESVVKCSGSETEGGMRVNVASRLTDLSVLADVGGVHDSSTAARIAERGESGKEIITEETADDDTASDVELTIERDTGTNKGINVYEFCEDDSVDMTYMTKVKTARTLSSVELPLASAAPAKVTSKGVANKTRGRNETQDTPTESNGSSSRPRKYENDDGEENVESEGEGESKWVEMDSCMLGPILKTYERPRKKVGTGVKKSETKTKRGAKRVLACESDTTAESVVAGSPSKKKKACKAVEQKSDRNQEDISPKKSKKRKAGDRADVAVEGDDVRKTRSSSSKTISEASVARNVKKTSSVKNQDKTEKKLTENLEDEPVIKRLRSGAVEVKKVEIRQKSSVVDKDLVISEGISGEASKKRKPPVARNAAIEAEVSRKNSKSRTKNQKPELFNGEGPEMATSPPGDRVNVVEPLTAEHTDSIEKECESSLDGTEDSDSVGTVIASPSAEVEVENPALRIGHSTATEESGVPVQQFEGAVHDFHRQVTQTSPLPLTSHSDISHPSQQPAQAGQTEASSEQYPDASGTLSFVGNDHSSASLTPEGQSNSDASVRQESTAEMQMELNREDSAAASSGIQSTSASSFYRTERRDSEESSHTDNVSNPHFVMSVPSSVTDQSNHGTATQSHVEEAGPTGRIFTEGIMPYTGHYPLLPMRSMDRHPLQSLEGLASDSSYVGVANNILSGSSFVDSRVETSASYGMPMPGYSMEQQPQNPTSPITSQSSNRSYLPYSKGRLMEQPPPAETAMYSHSVSAVAPPGFAPDTFTKEFFGQYFTDSTATQFAPLAASLHDQRGAGLLGTPYQQAGAGLPSIAQPGPGADLFRRVYSGVGDNFLTGVKSAVLSQAPSAQPSQHWIPGTDERRMQPWGRTSPVVSTEIDVSRHSYTRDRGDSVPAAGAHTSKRQAEREPTVFPSMPSALPTSDRYAGNAYSLAYSPPGSGPMGFPHMLPPGAANMSQKQFEDARQMTDYRAFAATHPHHMPSLPSAAPSEVYGGAGAVGLPGFDRYYYSARDAMYRSQQLAAAMPHAFMPQPATMPQYVDRTGSYGRESMTYGQPPSAYGFVSDKQYLPVGKPTAPGGEYFASVDSASARAAQDPYRHSVIYNMPRYF